MCELFPRTKPGEYNPLDTSLLRDSLKHIPHQQLPTELDRLTQLLETAENKQGKKVKAA